MVHRNGPAKLLTRSGWLEQECRCLSQKGGGEGEGCPVTVIHEATV